MKQKMAVLNTLISKNQMRMLDKLSEVSMKSKAVLVREAIDTLFRINKKEELNER